MVMVIARTSHLQCFMLRGTPVAFASACKLGSNRRWRQRWRQVGMEGLQQAGRAACCLHAERAPASQPLCLAGRAPGAPPARRCATACAHARTRRPRGSRGAGRCGPGAALSVALPARQVCALVARALAKARCTPAPLPPNRRVLRARVLAEARAVHTHAHTRAPVRPPTGALNGGGTRQSWLPCLRSPPRASCRSSTTRCWSAAPPSRPRGPARQQRSRPRCSLSHPRLSWWPGTQPTRPQSSSSALTRAGQRTLPPRSGTRQRFSVRPALRARVPSG